MVSLPDQFRKQYGKEGIYAGKSHFRDYWSRDALFACFGALSLGDNEVVGVTLNNFLDHLEKGHVPLRIGSISMKKKLLHLNPGYGAVHSQDKGNNLSIDGNALLLIIAEKYEQQTHKKLDREKLEQVAAWLITNEEDHLLHEGPYSSWEDSLNLSGPRLYTNVLHYRALLAASKLLKDPKYAAHAVQTKLAVRKWWSDTHFTDGPKRQAFMVAGNLLAILFGISDPKQSKAILERLAKRKTVCPPAGFFTITKREGYPLFFWLGMSDYHAATIEWSWLAGAEIAAYRAIGDDTEANRREELLRDLFERSGGVCEVYENDKPLKRLFYKTEMNFAWTMGVLIASRPSTVSILR